MSGATTLYREFSPSAALAPYVECYWQARSHGRESAVPREILLPDGTAQLMLSFGGCYRRFADADSLQGVRIAGSHIVGLRSTGIFIEQEGAEDIFAVRFRAGGLYPFLQIPMVEVVQRSVGLDLLLGPCADELEVRVFHADSLERRVHIAERMLLQRLAAFRERRPLADRVRHAVQRIYASRGTVSVDRLEKN